jgi:hypothetical protein
MAEHGIRTQREQASLVLESLLHLIKVLLDDDRSPSGEVNARRHTASTSTVRLRACTLRVPAEPHANLGPYPA